MRFVSAQLEGYLGDDAWLRAARAANAGAASLAAGLTNIDGADIVRVPEANIVFAKLPLPVLDLLEADGFGFYRVGSDGTIRLVVPWSVTDADVEGLLGAVRGHIGPAV
jgi:threonine aldolase